MEASQPGKWDSWVNEISLDSYLLLGYFFVRLYGQAG